MHKGPNLPTQPLNIGFIGAGANTKDRHLPGFAALPDVHLTAVANRSLASAQAVAADWNIGRVEADWQAVVHADDIDAICIGTYPDTHAELVIAALRAGKHVLCEARMAADLAAAQTMLRAAQAHPRQVLQIVPAPFTLAYDQSVRDFLDSGALGELRSIEITHLNAALLDASTPVPWRLRSACSGINMLSLGIFHETVLRWFDFTAEVTRARGFLRPRMRDLGADLPEALEVEARILAPQPATLKYHLSSIFEGPPQMDIRITGTAGSLLWDNAANRISIAVGNQPASTLASSRPDAWKVEDDFAASIRTGAPVRLTAPQTALAYMQFTQQVRHTLGDTFL
jgi:predicted dehydrogenase